MRANENMFVGKQWEGVKSNGLPTPQFNFIKRAVMFKVATVTTDNLKVNASPLAATPATDELVEPARIVTEEFDALMERNNVTALVRQFCRDAAVRGDGCLYAYWDDEAETGTKRGGAPVMGSIATEVVENTRVYFGNPNDRRVQSQPWVLIRTSSPVREVRRRARKNGAADWESIEPDGYDPALDAAKQTDDKATVLLLLWRDPDTKEIHAFEFTKDCDVRKPWNLGIRLYPVCWLNWDAVADSYHGQAEVTGLIPNQVAYNKVWAASILSMLTTAFPKVVYDPTRIKSWTNQIGAAIKAPGGDVNGVAKILDPAAISPQVYQYLDGLVRQTESAMGVTNVALGDSRPDNTSAIIALQRAAATPMELTKLALHDCVEDLFRIYLEFMAEYYGRRPVDVKTPDKVKKAIEFARQKDPSISCPDTVPVEFDFGRLRDLPMNLKLDVGATSYYSEIASLQTLDNLLKAGAISPRQYLERIPDGTIPAREELLDEFRQAEEKKTQPDQGGASPLGGLPMPGGAPMQSGGPMPGGKLGGASMPGGVPGGAPTPGGGNPAAALEALRRTAMQPPVGGGPAS